MYIKLYLILDFNKKTAFWLSKNVIQQKSFPNKYSMFKNLIDSLEII